tara:strand:- start:126 stop:662 length:537 start_codon:yes stop_codon:yes gene_type:complete
MSHLAFYASPIDFAKNEKVEKKRKEANTTKLNLDMLKKLAQPQEEDVRQIHENANSQIKEENDELLSDYYKGEMEKDLKMKITDEKHKQDLYQNENIHTDYLISNNLDANKVVSSSSSFPSQSQDVLLTKLNYIIDMFEEQKEIRTNQKNEEVILYSFLGIFVIYVLDSFVCIGKYKR